MLPEYPKFKPLELKDSDLLLQHLEQIPRKISDLALANFFIWEDFEHPQITFINQNPCFLLSPPNEPPYFLEPIGKDKIPETTEVCIKHTGRISRASEDFISLLPSGTYQITPLRNQFDYFYPTKTLAELKGRKFDGKRNHIKKFKQNFPNYNFVPLEPAFKKEALKLFDLWFELRKTSYLSPELDPSSQKKVIEKAFYYFEQLHLRGGAIRIEKELKGIILGSLLNSETISVHIQYGHPAYPGISQTLLWEACRKIFSSFTYLNLEQDLGIPGLRNAKLSYHPLRLEKKFKIKPLAT